jgi:protein O-mannosyl-transferase
MSPLRLQMSYFQVAWVWAVLLALTVGVYWPGLQGGFMFDDYPNIVTNPSIQIQSLSPTALSEIISSGGTGVLGRPLSMISFALNHAASGLNPFSFKIVNLGLHLFNGILIFWLARALLRQIDPAASGMLPVWVAAAWLLHPINLTPVLHVVQRMTELSTLFTLAGLLLYLHLRVSPSQSVPLRVAGWTGVLTLWLIGFLGKESAVLAPLFALLIELFVLHQRGNDKPICVLCRLAGLGLFVAAVAAVIAHIGIAAFSPEAFRYRDFSMSERVMTELRVLWFYVQLILLPAPSSFGLFHDDIAISRGWLSPWTTLAATIGWVIVLAGLIKYARRAPLVAFGIAWFLVGHLLESTILALELVHEHRNYLPAFGLLLAAAEVVRLYLLPKLGDFRLLAITLALAPITILTFNTGLRAYGYGDPVRLAKIEAAHHPDSARSQYEAGRVLAEAGHGWLIMYPDARAEIQTYYEHATKLDPNGKQALLAAMMQACVYGDPADPNWAEELRTRWQFSRFGVADRSAVADLFKQGINGKLCLDQTELVRQFNAILANKYLVPYDQAMAYALLGNIAQEMENNPELARSYYQKALKIMPTATIKLRHAQLLYTQKDFSGARNQLEAIASHEYDEDWQPSAARDLKAALTNPENTGVENMSPAGKLH